MWINKTLFFVVYYSIITPRSLSSLIRGMDSFFCRDYMVGVSIIRIYLNEFWVVIRVVQSTNIVSKGNIYGSWGRIRFISGSFVWSLTDTKVHGREIKIWTITINCKVVVEVVKTFPDILLSQ